MKHVLTFAIAVLSLTANQASAYELENVRTLVPKATADSYCPAGSAASYVPRSYQGETGQRICGADYHGPKTCMGVKAIAITASNEVLRYSAGDLTDCGQQIVSAWPWGRVLPTPDTLSTEWTHGDTYVVCCQ